MAAGTIDIHAHLPSRADVEDERILRFFEHGPVPVGDEPPVDLLLEDMDRGGIDRAVVLGSPPCAGFRHDNERHAALVARSPDRFIGFGTVDPFSEPDVAGAVRRCVEVHGFRGIGEFGYVDITDPACFPLYEACIEHDLPILIHMGSVLPTVPQRLGHPFQLDEVVLRYPELTVIAAHAGAPWTDSLATVAFWHPNVWIDLSALGTYPKLMRYQSIATLLAAGLGDRLLFGSDFPVTLPSAWLRELPSLELPWIARKLAEIPALSRKQWAGLRGDNARKLLKLG